MSILLAAWLGLGLVAAAGAAREDYTGTKACGSCHTAVYQAWQNTAHARAKESLGKSSTVRRCQSCHMTGDAPAGEAYFSGVGCESCHGPGAGYGPDDIMRNPELARALGLRDLSTPQARAAVCSGCHRSSIRIAAFDAEQAWTTIRHGDAPETRDAK
jgi:hypothetical protein